VKKTFDKQKDDIPRFSGFQVNGVYSVFLVLKKTEYVRFDFSLKNLAGVFQVI